MAQAHDGTKRHELHNGDPMPFADEASRIRPVSMQPDKKGAYAIENPTNTNPTSTKPTWQAKSRFNLCCYSSNDIFNKFSARFQTFLLFCRVLLPWPISMHACRTVCSRMSYGEWLQSLISNCVISIADKGFASSQVAGAAPGDNFANSIYTGVSRQYCKLES